MTSVEPHPTSPPPTPPLQFTLRTLLLLCVVLGSSLAVFGGWGIVVFGYAVGLAICLRQEELLRIVRYLTLGTFGLLLLIGLLFPITDPYYIERRVNWPNLTALAVWLLSVGVLLTHAVRSRKPRPMNRLDGLQVR